jgi:hypothetical protein
MPHILLDQLSDWGFWDYDKDKLDDIKSKRLIIKRVLSRGKLEDIRAIFAYYDYEDIRETVKDIKDFDPKTANFLSITLHIPHSEMRCYTEKPLIPFYHYKSDTESFLAPMMQILPYPQNK